MASDLCKDCVQICDAISTQQLARLFLVFRLAQEENDIKTSRRAAIQSKFATPRKDQVLPRPCRKVGRLAQAQPDAQASRCGQEIPSGRL